MSYGANCKEENESTRCYFDAYKMLHRAGGRTENYGVNFNVNLVRKVSRQPLSLEVIRSCTSVI